MSRMWAIVERELRRFRRSPFLIVVSMIFPLVQLVVLGYPSMAEAARRPMPFDPVCTFRDSVSFRPRG